MSSDKPQSEKMLIELSHKAYIADLQLREREAAAFNGDIVTDSEDDVYTKINDLTSVHVRKLIDKTRQRIRRKA